MPDGRHFTGPELMQRLWTAGMRAGAYSIEQLSTGLESVELQDAVRELEKAPGAASLPAGDRP